MRIIKKYSNRRLYDTTQSAYVNLDDVAGLVRGGEELKVLDVKTGEDLTRSVLLQVLLEQEGGGELFPVGLLHRMIRFGGATPFHRSLTRQLATGMELLDAQLTQLERQWGWMKQDVPPPPNDGPPPAEPDRGPEPESMGAPEPAPAGAAPADASADAELDALRQRLAQLEQRLSGDR